MEYSISPALIFLSVYAFSLITLTHTAPTISKMPARTNIFTSGDTKPGRVKNARILPPNAAATICGIQIVPLKRPK